MVRLIYQCGVVLAILANLPGIKAEERPWSTHVEAVIGRLTVDSVRQNYGLSLADSNQLKNNFLTKELLNEKVNESLKVIDFKSLRVNEAAFTSWVRDAGESWDAKIEQGKFVGQVGQEAAQKIEKAAGAGVLGGVEVFQLLADRLAESVLEKTVKAVENELRKTDSTGPTAKLTTQKIDIDQFGLVRMEIVVRDRNGISVGDPIIGRSNEAGSDTKVSSDAKAEKYFYQVSETKRVGDEYQCQVSLAIPALPGESLTIQLATSDAAGNQGDSSIGNFSVAELRSGNIIPLFLGSHDLQLGTATIGSTVGVSLPKRETQTFKSTLGKDEKLKFFAENDKEMEGFIVPISTELLLPGFGRQTCTIALLMPPLATSKLRQEDSKDPRYTKIISGYISNASTSVQSSNGELLNRLAVQQRVRQLAARGLAGSFDAKAPPTLSGWDESLKMAVQQFCQLVDPTRSPEGRGQDPLAPRTVALLNGLPSTFQVRLPSNDELTTLVSSIFGQAAAAIDKGSIDPDLHVESKIGDAISQLQPKLTALESFGGKEIAWDELLEKASASALRLYDNALTGEATIESNFDIRFDNQKLTWKYVWAESRTGQASFNAECSGNAAHRLRGKLQLKFDTRTNALRFHLLHDENQPGLQLSTCLKEMTVEGVARFGLVGSKVQADADSQITWITDIVLAGGQPFKLNEASRSIELRSRLSEVSTGQDRTLVRLTMKNDLNGLPATYHIKLIATNVWSKPSDSDQSRNSETVQRGGRSMVLAPESENVDAVPEGYLVKFEFGRDVAPAAKSTLRRLSLTSPESVVAVVNEYGRGIDRVFWRQREPGYVPLSAGLSYRQALPVSQWFLDRFQTVMADSVHFELQDWTQFPNKISIDGVQLEGTDKLRELFQQAQNQLDILSARLEKRVESTVKPEKQTMLTVAKLKAKQQEFDTTLASLNAEATRLLSQNSASLADRLSFKVYDGRKLLTRISREPDHVLHSDRSPDRFVYDQATLSDFVKSLELIGFTPGGPFFELSDQPQLTIRFPEQKFSLPAKSHVALGRILPSNGITNINVSGRLNLQGDVTLPETTIAWDMEPIGSSAAEVSLASAFKDLLDQETLQALIKKQQEVKTQQKVEAERVLAKAPIVPPPAYVQLTLSNGKSLPVDLLGKFQSANLDRNLAEVTLRDIVDALTEGIDALSKSSTKSKPYQLFPLKVFVGNSNRQFDLIQKPIGIRFFDPTHAGVSAADIDSDKPIKANESLGDTEVMQNPIEQAPRFEIAFLRAADRSIDEFGAKLAIALGLITADAGNRGEISSAPFHRDRMSLHSTVTFASDATAEVRVSIELEDSKNGDSLSVSTLKPTQAGVGDPASETEATDSAKESGVDYGIVRLRLTSASDMIRAATTIKLAKPEGKGILLSELLNDKAGVLEWLLPNGKIVFEATANVPAIENLNPTAGARIELTFGEAGEVKETPGAQWRLMWNEDVRAQLENLRWINLRGLHDGARLADLPLWQPRSGNTRVAIESITRMTPAEITIGGAKRTVRLSRGLSLQTLGDLRRWLETETDGQISIGYSEDRCHIRLLRRDGHKVSLSDLHKDEYEDQANPAANSPKADEAENLNTAIEIDVQSVFASLGFGDWKSVQDLFNGTTINPPKSTAQYRATFSAGWRELFEVLKTLEVAQPFTKQIPGLSLSWMQDGPVSGTLDSMLTEFEATDVQTLLDLIDKLKTLKIAREVNPEFQFRLTNNELLCQVKWKRSGAPQPFGLRLPEVNLSLYPVGQQSTKGLAAKFDVTTSAAFGINLAALGVESKKPLFVLCSETASKLGSETPPNLFGTRISAELQTIGTIEAMRLEGPVQQVVLDVSIPKLDINGLRAELQLPDFDGPQDGPDERIMLSLDELLELPKPTPEMVESRFASFGSIDGGTWRLVFRGPGGITFPAQPIQLDFGRLDAANFSQWLTEFKARWDTILQKQIDLPKIELNVGSLGLSSDRLMAELRGKLQLQFKQLKFPVFGDQLNVSLDGVDEIASAFGSLGEFRIDGRLDLDKLRLYLKAAFENWLKEGSLHEWKSNGLNDPSVEGEYRYELNLCRTIDSREIPLNLGLDGIGLRFPETTKIKLTTKLRIRSTLGINKGGPFLAPWCDQEDIAKRTAENWWYPQVEIETTADLPADLGAAELGIAKVAITSEKRGDIKCPFVKGTNARLKFVIPLFGDTASHPANHDPIWFSSIQIDPAKMTTEGGVDLGLQLVLLSNDKNIPRVRAGMDLSLNIGVCDEVFKVVKPQPLTDLFKKPDIQLSFREVELHMGDIAHNILLPATVQLEHVVKPVRELTAKLREPLPGIGALAGNISLLDIAQLFCTPEEIGSVRKLLDALNKVDALQQRVQAIASHDWVPVSALMGDVKPLVFRINSSDAQNSSLRGRVPFQMASVSSNDVLSKISAGDARDFRYPQLSRNTVSSMSGSMGETKITLPLFEDPNNALRLLLGQDVTLVGLRLPEMKFHCEYSQFFPIIGPVGARFGGEVGGSVNLGFGFDTYGLTHQGRNFLDGFYFADTAGFDGQGADIPEVILTAGIFGAAEINVVCARAGAGGGIYIDVTFNLHDNDYDGKIRFSELKDNWELGPIHIFDVGGRIYGKVFAYFEIGFKVFGKFIRIAGGEWSNEFTLVQFNLPRPAPKSEAIYFISDRLNTVNKGDAGFRTAQLWAENGIVYANAVDAANNTRRVPHAFNGVKLIGLLLAERNAQVQVEVDETVEVPVVIIGTTGDDILIHKGRGPAIILGLGGNDLIVGGPADDILVGGSGNDEIRGMGGNDRIHGGSLTDHRGVALEEQELRKLFSGISDQKTITELLKASLPPAAENDGVNILWGGDGDDRIFGGSEKDTIKGEAGNDEIHGGGGSDDLDGGRNNDRIYGNAGDDTLTDDHGDDLLVGGSGADKLRGGDGNDVLIGPSLEIDIVHDAGWIRDLFRDDLFQGVPNIADGPNRFSINRKEEVHDELNGGTGSDYLIGGDGNDDLIGEQGSDRLYGGGGIDKLWGGPGYDRLWGEGGNDFLFGGPDQDDLVGGLGDDYLFAGENIGTVESPVDDTTGDAPHLFWGDDAYEQSSDGKSQPKTTGIDRFYAAGTGPSTIIASDGHNVIRTGDGHDDITTGDADDIIDAGNGNNIVRAGWGANRVTTGNGNDTVFAGVDRFGGPIHNQVTARERRNWTRSQWSLQDGDYDLKANIIDTGAGDDHVVTGNGDDTILTQAGKDTVFSNGGNDDISAGPDNDVVVAGAGNDTVSGDGGDDLLIGEAGNDTLKGGSGRDCIWGGTPAMAIAEWKTNPSSQTSFAWFNTDFLDQQACRLPENLLGEANDDPIKLSFDGKWGDLDDSLTIVPTRLNSSGNDRRMDSVAGDQTDGNDTLFGDDNDDWLFGGGGTDELYGGLGNDYLDGGLDEDHLYGEMKDDPNLAGGNDVLLGGLGNDTLHGNAGIDQLYGGDGDDLLFGDETVADHKQYRQRLWGEAGSDTLYAFASTVMDKNATTREAAVQRETGLVGDALIGGDGPDLLYGNLRQDFLIGDSYSLATGGEADYLHGDYLDGENYKRNLDAGRIGGSDILYGDQGSDQLFGGGGNDSLYGGTDGDWLEGMDGNDVLSGGSGVDMLVLDVDSRYANLGGDDLDGHRWNRWDKDSQDDAVDILIVLGDKSWTADESNQGKFDRITLSDATEANEEGKLKIVYEAYDKPGGTQVRELKKTRFFVTWRTKPAGSSFWQPQIEQFQVQGLEENDVIRVNLGQDTIKLLAEGNGSPELEKAKETDRPHKASVMARPWVSVILGGPGNDLIDGSPGRDYIDGGPGSDIILGNAGDDRLAADANNSEPNFAGMDALFAGEGNDDLFGGTGTNFLFAWSRLPAIKQDEWKWIEERLTEAQLVSETRLAADFGVIKSGTIKRVAIKQPTGQANAASSSGEQKQPSDLLEDTGINRLLGGPGRDYLYGGTGIDLLFGNGGGDQLFNRHGKPFSQGDGSVAEQWQAYARSTNRVWYIGGSGGNDDLTIDYVTNPRNPLFGRHVANFRTRGYYEPLVSGLDNLTASSSEGRPVHDDFSQAEFVPDKYLKELNNELKSKLNEPTEAPAASDFKQRLRNYGKDKAPKETDAQQQPKANPTDQSLGKLSVQSANIRQLVNRDSDGANTEVLAIIIDGGEGNDTIRIGETVRKTVWIDAGPGNDTVAIAPQRSFLPDKSEHWAGKATRPEAYRELRNDLQMLRSEQINDWSGERTIRSQAYDLDLSRATRFLNLTIDSARGDAPDHDWYHIRAEQPFGPQDEIRISGEEGIPLFFEIVDEQQNVLLGPTSKSESVRLPQNLIDLKECYLHVWQEKSIPTIYDIEFQIGSQGDALLKGPNKTFDLGQLEGPMLLCNLWLQNAVEKESIEFTLPAGRIEDFKVVVSNGVKVEADSDFEPVPAQASTLTYKGSNGGKHKLTFSQSGTTPLRYQVDLQFYGIVQPASQPVELFSLQGVTRLNGSLVPIPLSFDQPDSLSPAVFFEPLNQIYENRQVPSQTFALPLTPADIRSRSLVINQFRTASTNSPVRLVLQAFPSAELLQQGDPKTVVATIITDPDTGSAELPLRTHGNLPERQQRVQIVARTPALVGVEDLVDKLKLARGQIQLQLPGKRSVDLRPELIQAATAYLDRVKQLADDSVGARARNRLHNTPHEALKETFDTALKSALGSAWQETNATTDLEDNRLVIQFTVAKDQSEIRLMEVLSDEQHSAIELLGFDKDNPARISTGFNANDLYLRVHAVQLMQTTSANQSGPITTTDSANTPSVSFSLSYDGPAPTRIRYDMSHVADNWPEAWKNQVDPPTKRQVAEDMWDYRSFPRVVRRDAIFGGDGHDRLLGGSAEDWIFGGPGNDVLCGGQDRQASDYLDGGPGNDLFQIVTDDWPLLPSTGRRGDPATADQLKGGEGWDRVLYLGGDVEHPNSPDLAQEYVRDYVMLGYDRFLGRYRIGTVPWIPSQYENTDAAKSEGKKNKSDSGRFAVRDSQPLVHYAYFQTTDIEGVLVDTRGGNDIVHADPGFYFGPSRQTWGVGLGDVQAGATAFRYLEIRGGTGSDLLFGSSGSDTIYGQENADIIWGGDGDDRILGGPQEDFLIGGRRRDPKEVFKPFSVPTTAAVATTASATPTPAPSTTDVANSSVPPTEVNRALEDYQELLKDILGQSPEPDASGANSEYWVNGPVNSSLEELYSVAMDHSWPTTVDRPGRDYAKVAAGKSIDWNDALKLEPVEAPATTAAGGPPSRLTRISDIGDFSGDGIPDFLISGERDDKKPSDAYILFGPIRPDHLFHREMADPNSDGKAPGTRDLRLKSNAWAIDVGISSSRELSQVLPYFQIEGRADLILSYDLGIPLPETSDFDGNGVRELIFRNSTGSKHVFRLLWRDPKKGFLGRRLSASSLPANFLKKESNEVSSDLKDFSTLCLKSSAMNELTIIHYLQSTGDSAQPGRIADAISLFQNPDGSIVAKLFSINGDSTAVDDGWRAAFSLTLNSPTNAIEAGSSPSKHDLIFANVKDVNGDGSDDLLIAAPQFATIRYKPADPANGGNRQDYRVGKVYLLKGKASINGTIAPLGIGNADPIDITKSNVIWQAIGIGSGLFPMGDLDRDGLCDFIISTTPIALNGIGMARFAVPHSGFVFRGSGDFFSPGQPVIRTYNGGMNWYARPALAQADATIPAYAVKNDLPFVKDLKPIDVDGDGIFEWLMSHSKDESHATMETTRVNLFFDIDKRRDTATDLDGIKTIYLVTESETADVRQIAIEKSSGQNDEHLPLDLNSDRRMDLVRISPNSQHRALRLAYADFAEPFHVWNSPAEWMANHEIPGVGLILKEEATGQTYVSSEFGFSGSDSLEVKGFKLIPSTGSMKVHFPDSNRAMGTQLEAKVSTDFVPGVEYVGGVTIQASTTVDERFTFEIGSHKFEFTLTDTGPSIVEQLAAGIAVPSLRVGEFVTLRVEIRDGTPTCWIATRGIDGWPNLKLPEMHRLPAVIKTPLASATALRIAGNGIAGFADFRLLAVGRSHRFRLAGDGQIGDQVRLVTAPNNVSSPRKSQVARLRFQSSQSANANSNGPPQGAWTINAKSDPFGVTRMLFKLKDDGQLEDPQPSNLTIGGKPIRLRVDLSPFLPAVMNGRAQAATILLNCQGIADYDGTSVSLRILPLSPTSEWTFAGNYSDQQFRWDFGTAFNELMKAGENFVDLQFESSGIAENTLFNLALQVESPRNPGVLCDVYSDEGTLFAKGLAIVDLRSFIAGTYRVRVYDPSFEQGHRLFDSGMPRDADLKYRLEIEAPKIGEADPVTDVDEIYGEDGDDVIVGGPSADRLFGGAGFDRFAAEQPEIRDLNLLTYSGLPSIPTAAEEALVVAADQADYFNLPLPDQDPVIEKFFNSQNLLLSLIADRLELAYPNSGTVGPAWRMKRPIRASDLTSLVELDLGPLREQWAKIVDASPKNERQQTTPFYLLAGLEYATNLEVLAARGMNLRSIKTLQPRIVSGRESHGQLGLSHLRMLDLSLNPIDDFADSAQRVGQDQLLLQLGELVELNYLNLCEASALVASRADESEALHSLSKLRWLNLNGDPNKTAPLPRRLYLQNPEGPPTPVQDVTIQGDKVEYTKMEGGKPTDKLTIDKSSWDARIVTIPTQWYENLKQLTHLRLSNRHVSDDELESISKLSQLRQLELVNNHLEDLSKLLGVLVLDEDDVRQSGPNAVQLTVRHPWRANSLAPGRVTLSPPDYDDDRWIVVNSSAAVGGSYRMISVTNGGATAQFDFDRALSGVPYRILVSIPRGLPNLSPELQVKAGQLEVKLTPSNAVAITSGADQPMWYVVDGTCQLTDRKLSVRLSAASGTFAIDAVAIVPSETLTSLTRLYVSTATKPSNPPTNSLVDISRQLALPFLRNRYSLPGAGAGVTWGNNVEVVQADGAVRLLAFKTISGDLKQPILLPPAGTRVIRLKVLAPPTTAPAGLAPTGASPSPTATVPAPATASPASTSPTVAQPLVPTNLLELIGIAKEDGLKVRCEVLRLRPKDILDTNGSPQRWRIRHSMTQSVSGTLTKIELDFADFYPITESEMELTLKADEGFLGPIVVRIIVVNKWGLSTQQTFEVSSGVDTFDVNEKPTLLKP